MDEPWKIYYDELYDRAADIPEQEFDRDEDMAEAAHEAYEAATDRLVNQLDYREDEALGLTHTFGRVVKAWIGGKVLDWDDLLERLETAQEEWEPSAGESSVR